MNSLYPIFASISVSLISLIGIFFLTLKHKLFNKIIIYLVSLSAGTLLGGAFLHLIPEAYEKNPEINIGLYILIGFIIFFSIENILHWHHCHQNQDCHHHLHTLSYMNLIGDGIHNFLDGLIISAAFLTSSNLGIITTLNIALHEIPQEIGDFGVLIHSGISKSKALLYNLLSASSAILGTIIGLSFPNSEIFAQFVLPIAAGGFIYIAATDLIPEIKTVKNKFAILTPFLLGIILMLLMKE